MHVRQFIQGCFGKLIRGCPRPTTGILLAHPSQSGMGGRYGTGGGYSGSTDGNNAVRSRLYLERPKTDDGEAPDDDERVLSRRKSNYYARQGDQLHLRWRDGVFQVDEKIHAGDPGHLGHLERERWAVVFLELLGKVIVERGHASDARNSDKYAPAIFAERPDRAGFKRRDFELAMERLFADGKILQSTFRTSDRKQRTCIVPKEGDDEA